MDTKQKAREIVEKEFRRNKRKNKNADYSTDEEGEEANARRKRPLITPSQVKSKDDKVSDSRYRDRAQERREGTFKQNDEEGVFDWKEDRNTERKKPISVPLQEDVMECTEGRFETREQAQEFLQSNPTSSTVLGRAMIRFWLTRWHKVNPNAPPKLSSSVYTMTTATHPPLQIMPTEKTYPSSTTKSSRPLLPDELLHQIKSACTHTKERRQTANARATSSEEPIKKHANEDEDDDIFGDLGQYDEQEDIDEIAPTRKGEKVILFEPEESEVALALILPVKAQSQRLEGFSPAMAEIDYPDDGSSGDEKKQKKKKRKKQRSGSDSD